MLLSIAPVARITAATAAPFTHPCAAALITAGQTRLWISLRFVRQAQRCERDTREAEAEFLQRPASCGGLGQTLGQFIEFVVHNFAFVWDS